MKLFLKFSLLLGLILAGRYSQLPAGSPGAQLPKSFESAFITPDSSLVRYTATTDTTATLIIPVSQRKSPSLTLY